MRMGHRSIRMTLPTSAAVWAMLVAALPASAGPITSFTTGDLVFSVYGDGDGSGTYADNSASPITLEEVTTSGAEVGQLVLPQATTTLGGVTDYAISGEYGSSSEGTLQLSGNGQYLTIAGYGVSAAAFNANPQSYGGATKGCINDPNPCYPLAQTASVANFPGSAGSGVTTAVVVPRVIALIGANGSVDTSTALTGVFNENNPRSVATVNGTSFYISGQGASKTDTTTQGLFYATRGATTATAIDTSFDTRTVEIQNNQLYLSADSTEGSGVHENISSYGSPGSLPTTSATATILPNLKSKYSTTSASQLNTLDSGLGGSKIYLSPENYFFANATTLYIADSGNPKGDNNGSGGATQGLSDGGLQKWIFVGGNWQLEYTLSTGLNLVPDTTVCTANETDCGTTGLIGLTGEVIGNEVELFATNATLGDEDPTYLYGIDDLLSSTTGAGEDFTLLDTAAPDTNIRGVAFAPSSVQVPEPSSLSLFVSVIGLLGLTQLSRRSAGRAQRRENIGIRA
jgi:hypothetical protein